MGLDIYVGSLSRYYSGGWETVAEQAAREQGLDCLVLHIGDNGEEQDLEEIRARVLAWRDWMNAEVPILGAPLSWPEDFEGIYFTDEPDWEGWTALVLWAAYKEQPRRQAPPLLPQDITADPAFRATQKEGFQSRFPHLLYGAHIWLPVPVQQVFDAPDPFGEDARFGSSVQLLAELDELNRLSWKADLADLESWRQAPPEGQPGLEGLARFGLAVVRHLTARSVEHGLPMLLDS
jgi:hypothetical protein